MSWGDPFSIAWQAATDTAKVTAAGIAAGATAIGRTVVARSQWAAGKAGSAAVIATEALRQGAVEGVRGTLEAVGSPVLGALGKIGEAGREISDQVGTAFDKVSGLFGQKEPKDPVEPCAIENPTEDVDFDGCLISYPGGKCGAVTEKGNAIGTDDIAAAEENAYQSQSDCCEAMRRSGAPSKTIVYVNGVNTTKEQDCDTLKAIGDQTCAKVYGVYNATEGFLRDAAQTGEDRNLIFEANDGHSVPSGDGRNPAVDSLSQLIQTKSVEGEPAEIWAHSQGGAITSLALYDADNALNGADIPDGLGGVTVKSFGSAAPHWPDGPSYEHYVQVNDATPVLFGLGDNPATDGDRAGAGATVIRFSGSASDPKFQTDDLDKSVPLPTANHGVTETYLKMEKQEHGGCSG